MKKRSQTRSAVDRDEVASKQLLTSPAPARLVGVLLVGVLAMSSASIFIRWALDDGVQPVVVAAYRLSIAFLALTLPAVRQRVWMDYAKLDIRDALIIVASGTLLALHFIVWISSLANTSVLNSVVLVSTTPLWIGIASPMFLKERPPAMMWAGLLCAVLGATTIGLADIGMAHPIAELGDVLALSGAIFGAGYLMIGRRVRSKLSLIGYVWVAYGIAAVVLILWAGLASLPMLGFGPRTVLWLVALGLIPQLIGHTAANYVIRHVSATLVGVGTLGEPVGASILALLLLNELPRPVQVAGALVVLIGICVASLGETRSKSKVTLVSSN